jgi:hypothetical protein
MTKQLHIGRLRKLAYLMDAQYTLPGGFKIGWDGILGFFPGIGDLITNFISAYIVIQAAMLGCPPAILLRMGLNLLIENLLDAIPLFGNFFDIFWKSNLKNVDLLEHYFESPLATRRNSRWIIALTVLSLFGLLLCGLFLIGASAYLIWFVLDSQLASSGWNQ